MKDNYSLFHKLYRDKMNQIRIKIVGQEQPYHSDTTMDNCLELNPYENHKNDINQLENEIEEQEQEQEQERKQRQHPKTIMDSFWEPKPHENQKNSINKTIKIMEKKNKKIKKI